MVEEVKLKELEITIELKKGEYFTRDEFIKRMGIGNLFDDNNPYAKSRFFNEIIGVLKKIGAVKVAGSIKLPKRKNMKGRHPIVYKAVKDIKMRWVVRD